MRFVVLACLLQIVFLWIRRLADLGEHVAETISALLVAGLLYVVSSYFAVKHFNSTRSTQEGVGRRRWIAGLIVLAGILFRLTVWPLSPGLSDDPFRYRWEGKLQAAGGNPYQARPNDAEWRSLRDATFPRVGGKDFKAGYGPLIEQLEWWTYRVVSAAEPDPARQAFWFKLPYALLDLAVMAALWFWLAARGLPRERILVYAWSPLAVMEFWAAGHNDSVAILLVVLALVAADRRRWVWAFAALSLATAAKFWPALLFPLFIGWKGRRPERWWQWSVAIPVLGVLAWPYWSNVWENARFMTGFVGGWRNNDSLFAILLRLAGDDLYRAKHAAFAIILTAVLVLVFARVPLERAVLWTVAVTLMVSSNCHPWYLTWMIPLLAVMPVPSLLLWTVLAPLAYIAVIPWTILGEWQGSAPVRLEEYVPVYGLLVGTAVWRWIAARRVTRPVKIRLLN